MTAEPIQNVLFLCTGNSARSILAEALLNDLGQGCFRAFSAGSFPKGQVHPAALELLERLKLPTEGLRSKSWDEFAGTDAPQMDYILTVCDQAAGEVCPVWPGHPMTAHWGLADPAAVTDPPEEQTAAFREAARILKLRIQAFLASRFEGMSRTDVQKRLADVGQYTDGVPT